MSSDFDQAVYVVTQNHISAYNSTPVLSNGQPLNCPDSYRRTLEVSWIGNNCTVNWSNALPCITTKRIVIVLESPHTDEFERKNNIWRAIAPAQGRAGRSIEKNFCTIFEDYLKKNNRQNICGRYDVYLVNAIQYQCSLGMPIANSPKNKILRQCLASNNFQLCLKQRLQCLSADIIVNSCTGNINKNPKKIVHGIINQVASTALILRSTHPSYGGYTKKGLC